MMCKHIETLKMILCVENLIELWYNIHITNIKKVFPSPVEEEFKKYLNKMRGLYE